MGRGRHRTRARTEIPDGVEIIAPDPRTRDAASSSGISTDAPRAAQVVLLLLGLALGVAGIDALFDSRRDRTVSVTADRWSAAGVITIDLREEFAAAGFPLFDREWDHELIATSGGDTTAIDLDTGEARPIDAPDSPAFAVQTIRSIDHEVYVTGFSAVHHPTGPGSMLLVPDTEDSHTNWSAEGNYWLDPTDTVRFVAIGDDMFFESHEPRGWRVAELLLVESGRAAWRECTGPTECTYWSGRLDPPSRRRLDPGTGPLGLRSPSGRYGWSVDVDFTGPAFPEQLFESGPGGSILLGGIVGTPAVFPDQSAIFASREGRLIVIDTASGEAREIPVPALAGASLSREPIVVTFRPR